MDVKRKEEGQIEVEVDIGRKEQLDRKEKVDHQSSQSPYETRYCESVVSHGRFDRLILLA